MWAEGACIPALMMVVMISAGMGVRIKRRMLRRVRMAVMASIGRRGVLS